MRLVKLRDIGGPSAATGDYNSLGFTIPREIARTLVHLKGKYFSCELTEDGILFRMVEGDSPTDVPTWVNTNTKKKGP